MNGGDRGRQRGEILDSLLSRHKGLTVRQCQMINDARDRGLLRRMIVKPVGNALNDDFGASGIPRISASS